MRPKFHFTPPRNWMNDPHGLIWLGRKWHLFYQHNPHGLDWGRLHWGHAVSTDLLHWEHLPIAIAEDPAADLMIFSGSAVVTDASGRRPGQERVAAFFTAHFGGGAEHWKEHVHAAWSDDGGQTFVASPVNPVVRGTAKKFGDPKVWWDERHQAWFMANIAGWPDRGHIVFARSTDLDKWEVCGRFQTDENPHAVWECPDVFRLAVDDGTTIDVLKVNTWVVASGAKTTAFYLGRFDGATFHADGPAQRGPTPVGDNSYAETSWENLPASDGRRIMHGWLPQKPHHARDYTGTLWLPRELTAARTAAGIELRYSPVRELLAHRHTPLTHAELTLGESRRLESAALATAHEWELQLRVAPGTRVVIAFAADARFIVDAAQGELALEFPAGRAAKPWRDFADPLDVRLILDGSVVDVFAARGAFATAAVFDDVRLSGAIDLSATGEAKLLRANSWSLA